MRVLVRRLKSLKGTTAFQDQEIDAPVLRIGRGTEQELELSDLRVALAHAEISALPDGTFRVLARTANGIWVNGGLTPGSELEVGDTIDAGHHRITMLRPEAGVDLALLVEERDLASDKSQPVYRTELSQTSLSRRRLAWLAFAVITMTMLAIPALQRYGPGPVQADAKPLWPSDHVWLSGPVSRTHAFFEADCAACHAAPFEAVRNDACLACHDTTRHHVTDTGLLRLYDFAAAQCTDCHREHNGSQGTIVRAASQCTDCHADPAKRFPGTHVESVRSFAHSHPAFSPQVSAYDLVKHRFQWRETRQAPGTHLKEQTNLTFPHDLHVDPKGVDAPQGTRVLACNDCHVLDRGQSSFEPVTMERHCAGCHRLEFDPANPTRQVPHGKPAEVAGVVRDYFAAKALSGNVKQLGTLPAAPNRRRPGPLTTGRGPRTVERAATWSEAEGDRAVEEVFTRRVCRYCHVVQPTDDPLLPWTIAPVALEEHAMRNARFSHAPHQVQPCTDCHQADRSHDSADVLLPTIDNCRQCHGDMGSRSQVASACIDCHAYHEDGMPLWDAQAPVRKKALLQSNQTAMPGGASP